jgi:TatD DNase family protein
VDCNLWHKDLQGGAPLLLSKETTNQNNDDTTTPLQQSPFDILLDDAVKEQNICAILSPSSTIKESKTGVDELMKRETTSSLPQILTTVGIHPYHVSDDDTCSRSIEENMNQLRAILDNKQQQGRVVIAAIGECGLDRSEGFPPLQDQIPYFQQQVELAEHYNLPLFVHERLAFQECMDILSSTSVPIIIHCFTGNPEECKQYVDRGYYLSVSGYICKNVGDSVRKCLQNGLIPLDRLMVETDSPYLGFAECGKHYLDKHADEIQTLNAKKRKRLQKSTYPNVPSSLPLVVDAVVDCLNAGRAERGEEVLERDDVARQMSRNAIKFFGFDPIDGL